MVPMGAVLAGKYRIDRVLGQGGMGLVVQATHLQLHQPVAMKFLLPEVLASPQVVQRFLREAQAVVRLKSEHVARVLDVGELDNGAPYMVLEFLEGTDLAHFPREQLTIGQIVNLILQACEALAEAHALGIVHRDIKPANFFVTRAADGALLMKVLDFGISKAQQAPHERETLEANLTATSVVMGTPTYMSPEQMKSSRDVDIRSDIWSLGVVLYELLQGTAPFVAESFGSMAIKVATEPLPPLTVRLPSGLAEIVYRCLEKDPARRYQNVAELAHVLAPFAQSTSQAAITMERTSRVLRTDPPQVRAATAARGPGRGRGRRLPIILGSGIVAGAAIAIAIALMTGGRRGASPEGGAGSAGAVEVLSPGSGEAIAPAPTPAPAQPPAEPVAAVDAGAPPVEPAPAEPAPPTPAEPVATPPPAPVATPPRRTPRTRPTRPSSPSGPVNPDDILDTRH